MSRGDVRRDIINNHIFPNCPLFIIRNRILNDTRTLIPINPPLSHAFISSSLQKPLAFVFQTLKQLQL